MSTSAAEPVRRPATEVLVADDSRKEEYYDIKEILWHANRAQSVNQGAGAGKSLPPSRYILTQNENGPCPLIAITNVLILLGHLDIRPGMIKKLSLPSSPISQPPAQDQNEQWVVSNSYVMNALHDYLLSLGEANKSGPRDKGKGVLKADEDPIAVSFEGGFDSPKVGIDADTLMKVMEILPTLNSGLIINLRFDGPLSFDETDSLLLFKAFGIRLCHGWTIDPQDQATYRAVIEECDSSYEKCLDKLVLGSIANEKVVKLAAEHEEMEKLNERLANAQLNSGSEAQVSGVDGSQHQATPIQIPVIERSADKIECISPTTQSAIHTSVIISNFLESSASQLTVHGISSLVDILPDSSLSVFFRNNHFSTLWKVNNRLYTLVTDHGFIDEPDVVWESLSNVEGDSIFFDAFLRQYKGNNAASSMAQPKYQMEYQYLEDALRNPGHHQTDAIPLDPGYDADLALAIALQQEEERNMDEYSTRPSQNAAQSLERKEPLYPTNKDSTQNTSSYNAGNHLQEHYKASNPAIFKKKNDKCLIM